MLFVPKLERQGWRDFDVSDSMNSAIGGRILIAYPRLIEPANRSSSTACIEQKRTES
jgi:hypothetical protein